MLEKPNIRDARIAACVRNQYDMSVGDATFLPLGADEDSAVYRVADDDLQPYLLKLRRGTFSEVSVHFPKLLADQGVVHVIAPLPTKTGQLWGRLDAWATILYPFIEGRDGYEVALSDQAWGDLGKTLKRIHTVDLPPTMLRCFRREEFSPGARECITQRTNPRHAPCCGLLQEVYASLSLQAGCLSPNRPACQNTTGPGATRDSHLV